MVKLEYYRKMKGMTQAELAKRVGIAQGNISKMENGKQKPNAYTAVKLADVLDVSLDELLR